MKIVSNDPIDNESTFGAIKKLVKQAISHLIEATMTQVYDVRWRH